jgi:hypothetical protein
MRYIDNYSLRYHMADDETSSSDENLRCLKCYLPRSTYRGCWCHLLSQHLLKTTTEEEATGTAAWDGTAERKPLLVSGCLVGLWLLPPLCGTLLRSTRLRLRPCSSRPHRLVLVRSIRQYYPYSAITPMCSYVPDSMATTGGPVNNLNQHPSKSE